MSKANPLSGLIGNYGDSDDDSEEEMSRSSKMRSDLYSSKMPPAVQQDDVAVSHVAAAAIHPSPVPHCPWSACYDESTGYTYYWNQYTNAVTWDTPPEYLLALKLAQQQLQASGSSEVSAEEWQLYQQALAEKQNAKVVSKSSSTNSVKATDSKPNKGNNNKHMKNGKTNRKRRNSESEDEKIELITSYYHSDSDSNEEAESHVKPAKPPITVKPKEASPKPIAKPPKPAQKKQKTKPQPVEYGPPLPPNQDYTVPIGPEMPPNIVMSEPQPAAKAVTEVENKSLQEEEKKPVEELTKMVDEDEELLKQLKDKAKLLEKLGGEIPSELKEIINEDKISRSLCPAVIADENSKDSKSTLDTNIDDLLEEIEKKELPKKMKSKVKIDIFGDDSNFAVEENKEKSNSGQSTPKSLPRSDTPPLEESKILFPSSKAIISEEKNQLFPSSTAIIEEQKPLFPSSISIIEEQKPPSTAITEEQKTQFPSSEEITEDEQKPLFPSAVNIESNPVQTAILPSLPEEITTEKKGVNIYLMDANEPRENVNKKKLRISNSVLPERKVNEVPAYTTKYSSVEGFSGERTGLGFGKYNEVDGTDSPKKAISYGKGLMFTKGEILNEDKKDEIIEDTINLLEAKLKFLNQQQIYPVSPVQEMTIQMQTLIAAHRSNALMLTYLRRWLEAASESLRRLEETAAPPGWTCRFHRSEGRYEYRRETDGFTQWEYPAGSGDDMDISTTPPHPGTEDKELSLPPPPPPPPQRVVTPPPPAWDPPPPGCDDHKEPKKEIGDELLSFYNDIAELEKTTPTASNSNSPERSKEASLQHQTPPPPVLRAPTPPLPPLPSQPPPPPELKEEKEIKSKKKSKVKISASVGLKHKTVSSLVAKWQQVADEINSD